MNTSLALISDARKALAEAKTLPDLRRVMEAATVAADAIRRQAELMKAQGIASEIVDAANDAANDAAAVRIEAQAQAGGMVAEMAASGERARAGNWKVRGAEVNSQSGSLATAQELVGSDTRQAAHQQIHRWQQVADVPEEVRQRYVDTVRSEGGEVTTAGLMRFSASLHNAGTGTQLANGHLAEQVSKEVSRACRTLTALSPEIVAGWYLNNRRKTELRRLVGDLQGWTQELSTFL